MREPGNIRMTIDRPGDFAATSYAEKMLEQAGFAVGSSQRGSPRGIMFGNYHVSKWRNLRPSEIEQLHGQIIGDGRNGPLTIKIFSHAPQDAVDAFKSACGLRVDGGK